MNLTLLNPLVTIVAAASIACSCSPQQEPESPSNVPASEESAEESATPGGLAEEDWRTSFDFDGDGTQDPIVDIRYSGGAHCCYHLSIELSAADEVMELDHPVEGGYTHGLDLSQPTNFNIQDYDGDGADELCIQPPIIGAGMEEPTYRVHLGSDGSVETSAGPCDAP